MAAAHQKRKIASVRISGETGTAMRFTEPNSFGAANSKTVERSLAAEVARLQKLSLDETLSQSVEEAERLVNTGHYQEAEALLQNADARSRRRSTDCLSNTR
jgi:hypothetical protein